MGDYQHHENRRQWHTATCYKWKVLVAGGTDIYFNPLSSTEVYDYANGTNTETGSLNTGRYVHTATLLPNGNVLVAAGIVAAAMSPARSYSIRPPDMDQYQFAEHRTR